MSEGTFKEKHADPNHYTTTLDLRPIQTAPVAPYVSATHMSA